MNGEPSVLGVLRRRSVSNGGGKNGWTSGIRPVFQILPDYLTSGEVTFLGDGPLMPGGTMRVAIRFVTPEHYAQSLRVGDVIDFGTGPQVHGTLKIQQILDPSLQAPSK